MGGHILSSYGAFPTSLDGEKRDPAGKLKERSNSRLHEQIVDDPARSLRITILVVTKCEPLKARYQCRYVCLGPWTYTVYHP